MSLPSLSKPMKYSPFLLLAVSLLPAGSLPAQTTSAPPAAVVAPAAPATNAVATTPTPARACAHRAATAGLDELITMTNAPVAGSRAMRENVMASAR